MTATHADQVRPSPHNHVERVSSIRQRVFPAPPRPSSACAASLYFAVFLPFLHEDATTVVKAIKISAKPPFSPFLVARFLRSGGFGRPSLSPRMTTSASRVVEDEVECNFCFERKILIVWFVIFILVATQPEGWTHHYRISATKHSQATVRARHPDKGSA